MVSYNLLLLVKVGSNVIEKDVIKKTVDDGVIKKVNASHTNNASDLCKKADFNSKIEDIGKKISNLDNYLTTKEFNNIKKID